MLFRRSSSLVEAIQIDGTEAALATVFATPCMGVKNRGSDVEVVTPFGRRLAHRGDWITRDVATRSIRLYEDGAFQAAHEMVMCTSTQDWECWRKGYDAHIG